ncbi:acyl-CoA dehydrogenase family protein [Sphingomonas sp. NFR15]|uniref:acyl-CoA dehydrogenase family protein n=1 Tax=Sphingomonas sp. NFR15 TaxID=1566282 RepID=UPI00088E6254|nr:acyl-CoA dehydrogenase family protein [Sphingomonas sp. NFR15]SDA16358.1 Acyl-CoA dehydrogenase [Sphingomonas sp. NFR15]
MNIAPGDEQVMVRDMVRRFLADRYDATNMASGPMPAEDWRALGELGLFAFLLPESVGGMGGGAMEVMIVAEELGRALAVTPLSDSVVLCGHVIARGGAAGAHWSEPLAQGDAVLGFARGGIARAGALSGAAGIVPGGMAASAFVVACETGGVTLVEADAPGVARSPVRLVDGSIAADLRFEGARCVPLDISEGDLSAAVELAELAIVAELAGAMGTLLDLAIDYVRQRKQFGKPIGSFQAIQHRCARLYTLLEQSRSMMLRAALVRDDARGQAVTEAKAYVCDAALRLAEDVVQLHGGMGVTDELAVGRGLRRVLLLSRLHGGSAAARMALAA